MAINIDWLTIVLCLAAYALGAFSQILANVIIYKYYKAKDVKQDESEV